MELKEILAISGKGGLFKMVSQAKKGVIVESLTDGKRFPAFLHDKLSSLEEISIFTTGEEDKPLKDVFKAIFEKYDGGQIPEVGSDSTKLRSWFEGILPEFDKERVYVSDIKKVIIWYNQLHEKNLLDFTEPVEAEKPATDEKPAE
ncbi:MAG TPA: hypothetical protein DEO70_13610 [Bacteroidales bacterium]|nr:MAG: hypothetical protein A2X11_08895 [Bacteroidetes bacterium GWE2_42_24]OFY29947.1 MAG: hypothetical protein A2X09_15770 [Bacteroidetes bacterium GWF2_43_11]HBZ67866.1 hypothetical protein [Bacteroidales bacterium]